MTPELGARLLKVSRVGDRLTQIKSIIEEEEGTSMRGHVASAAVAAAEYVAAVTGNSAETGLIHRAYEEVLAALENSPAMQEMVQDSRVVGRVASADNALLAFRMLLVQELQ